MSQANDGIQFCKECGASRQHWSNHDRLGALALHGPRNIRAADIDRIIDDDGKRILVVEEKAYGEKVSPAQHRLLLALAATTGITVWGARGTTTRLTVTAIPTGQVLVDNGNWTDYENAVTNWFNQRDNPIDKIADDLADLEWCHQAGADIAVRAAELQTILTPFLHQTTTTN